MMLQGAIEALARPGDELDMQGRCSIEDSPIGSDRSGDLSVRIVTAWRRCLGSAVWVCYSSQGGKIGYRTGYRLSPAELPRKCRTDSKNGEQSILDQKSWR